jgi:hypothetical protein
LGDFCEHAIGRVVRLREAETLNDFAQNLAIGLGAFKRFHRGVDALHAALAVGEGAAFFQEGSAGRMTLANLAVSVMKNLLHHEELEIFHRGLDVLGVRVGLHHVLAHQPERLETAVDGGIVHLRDFPAGFGGRGRRRSR